MAPTPWVHILFCLASIHLSCPCMCLIGRNIQYSHYLVDSYPSSYLPCGSTLNSEGQRWTSEWRRQTEKSQLNHCIMCRRSLYAFFVSKHFILCVGLLPRSPGHTREDHISWQAPKTSQHSCVIICYGNLAKKSIYSTNCIYSQIWHAVNCWKWTVTYYQSCCIWTCENCQLCGIVLVVNGQVQEVDYQQPPCRPGWQASSCVT